MFWSAIWFFSGFKNHFTEGDMSALGSIISDIDTQPVQAPRRVSKGRKGWLRAERGGRDKTGTQKGLFFPVTRVNPSPSSLHSVSEQIHKWENTEGKGVLSWSAPDASPLRYGPPKFGEIPHSARGCCSSAGKALPWCPPWTQGSIRFLSTSLTSPPARTQTLTQSHTRRGEWGRVPSGRQCQSQNTQGLQRSPAASNGQGVGRWKAPWDQETQENKNVFLFRVLSLFPRRHFVLQKELNYFIFIIFKNKLVI